jgi:hypothetical protein
MLFSAINSFVFHYILSACLCYQLSRVALIAEDLLDITDCL